MSIRREKKTHRNDYCKPKKNYLLRGNKHRVNGNFTVSAGRIQYVFLDAYAYTLYYNIQNVRVTREPNRDLKIVKSNIFT